MNKKTKKTYNKSHRRAEQVKSPSAKLLTFSELNPIQQQQVQYKIVDYNLTLLANKYIIDADENSQRQTDRVLQNVENNYEKFLKDLKYWLADNLDYADQFNLAHKIHERYKLDIKKQELAKAFPEMIAEFKSIAAESLYMPDYVKSEFDCHVIALNDLHEKSFYVFEL